MPDSAPSGWSRAQRGLHWWIAALVFAGFALGWLMVNVIPVPHLVGTNPAWFAFLRQTHRLMAILLAAIGAGHAVAAIHHHRRGRNTLAGMWRGPPMD
jgi:cytochrome b561